jgi:hypothetical protein
MSEKIRDLLNELEQKDKNVEDTTDINISMEFNAERKRERYNKINLKLDEYFPDKGMFFYKELEIYCIEKKLNYENIRNSKYPFFKYLYAVKSSVEEINTDISIGSLKGHYFSSSRGCPFSRLSSFIIPFADYHYRNPNIIDIRSIGDHMGIIIKEYDGFKIVLGNGGSNHRLYGIYRGIDEFSDSKLLLNTLEKTVYEPIDNEFTYYLRTYILPKLSDGTFTINFVENDNLVLKFSNSAVEFKILYFVKNPLERPIIQELLNVIERIYKIFENKGMNNPLITIKNEDEKILELTLSEKHKKEITPSLISSKFSSNNFAAAFAIFIVCSSRDSLTFISPLLPSIVGLIPIFG